MDSETLSQDNLSEKEETENEDQETSEANPKRKEPEKEMSEIRTEILANESKKYIRVATDYYRLSHTLTARIQTFPVQLPWTRGAIVGDYGKEILGEIKKFVAFVNIPDNTETYRKEHFHNGDGYYNLYEEIKHVPKPGDIAVTMEFLSRMFQDKMDILLDYLKILFENPTQSLPVVCLVSKKQETGKSQYMSWLCEIFGRNGIILGNEEFSTNFNSLYASKLIICIDETFIDKIIVKEKIKRLTTSNTINMEAKGRDSVRMDFFGKIVLSSNTEDNFMKMDDDDNRFFVVKVPILHDEEKIENLPKKLEAEIPAFLHMLKSRQLVYPRKSRLWFDPKVYETDALSKLRKNTQGTVQKELLRWFEDVFAFDETGNEIYVTPVRLSNVLKESLKQIIGLPTAIARVIKEEWQLPQSKNAKFKFYYIEDQWDESEHSMVSKLVPRQDTGKFYTVTREFVASKTNS